MPPAPDDFNPMPNVLFLASTPLHSFWSLGLARGAFAGWNCSLALIDQRTGDTDYIADALAMTPGAIREVVRFQQIGKRPIDKLRRGRAAVASIKELASRLKPDYVAVGNDRRVEFHAALAAAPGATGAYLDDGMFSYLPMKPRRTSRLGSLLSTWARRGVYGVAAEHPDFVGGSRAVTEAWVMLPGQVHAGLRDKRLRCIEPTWFQDALVKEVCAQAALAAGIDPDAVRQARLLLVLPHESFLRAHPPLLDRLRRLMEQCAARGEHVMIKRHPRSQSESLEWPGTTEVPRRLPIEILAPLLTDALVVGTLTTALISLRLLGKSLDVRYLDVPGRSGEQALPIYRAAGVRPLDDAHQ